jgi:hypothetical protein
VTSLAVPLVETRNPSPGGVQTSSSPAPTRSEPTRSLFDGRRTDRDPTLTTADMSLTVAPVASTIISAALTVRAIPSMRASGRSTLARPAKTTRDRASVSVVGRVRSQASRPESRKLPSWLIPSIDSDREDDSTLGVRPDVFPAPSCQPLPGAVVTVSDPQPVLTDIVAGPSKAPCVVATLVASPRVPHTPAYLGATARAPPTTRPGTAAASIRPGRLNRVFRSTILRPMATIASGQRRRMSVSVVVSTAPRSAVTRTPPIATSRMPQ